MTRRKLNYHSHTGTPSKAKLGTVLTQPHHEILGGIPLLFFSGRGTNANPAVERGSFRSIFKNATTLRVAAARLMADQAASSWSCGVIWGALRGGVAWANQAFQNRNRQVCAGADMPHKKSRHREREFSSAIWPNSRHPARRARFWSPNSAAMTLPRNAISQGERGYRAKRSMRSLPTFLRASNKQDLIQAASACAATSRDHPVSVSCVRAPRRFQGLERNCD